jgi:hypothetical protein
MSDTTCPGCGAEPAGVSCELSWRHWTCESKEAKASGEFVQSFSCLSRQRALDVADAKAALAMIRPHGGGFLIMHPEEMAKRLRAIMARGDRT